MNAALTQPRGPAHRVWLRMLPSPLSLDPCTGAECALCWWKIIYQSLWWHCCTLFCPNVTFKGGFLLTHYCSKATELRNCLGQLNEVPIMIAMIKFPPWCSNKSSAHLTPPFNLHCLPEKRAKSLFSPIRLFLIDLDFTLFRTFMVLFWYCRRQWCGFFS